LVCVTEKFMTIHKMTCRSSLVLFFLALALVTQVQAQEVKKIIIMPFEIYSKGDIAAIRKTLHQKLSEELGKEKLVRLLTQDKIFTGGGKINEKQAIKTGKSLGADFVIIGSMTQLGETVSIDARIIDVHTARALPAVSIQGKGPADIGRIAAQFKIEILSRAGLMQKVAKIEVKGNRKIEAQVITQQLRTKAGKPFVEADITSDIKAIFKMGFFQDVSADVADSPAGKVVIFIVQEKGLISEIRIEGNKALDKDVITDALTIKTRQSLNREKIVTDIEKVKALYDGKGYYNAEITDRVEKEGEKDFRIIINIKENDRLYIKSITFEGNEAFTAKELKNMMTSTEYSLLHFMSDTDVLKRDLLKQDVGKLTSYYFNNGFINVQISEPEITHDKKWIYVKIKIEEGKRFKIGKVEISGDLLKKPREELLKALRTKEGSNYDREAVMKDIDLITSACNDEGHANADVTPKIDTKEKEQLANVDYNIKTGELVYFNRIIITGNTITRDKVIRRELEVIEGDLYSSSQLKTSYKNLNRLRYFEEVDFQTEKGPDKSLMDVNIRVKEKNTGMFMVGAGYSAIDQAIIMAQITQQNFLGRGQIMSLKASLGSTTNNYELSFTEPWLFDIPLWFKYDIWKYKKNYDSYTWDSRGTGFTVAYPIWEKISASIGYKITIDDIQDINLSTAPSYITAQGGQTTTSAVTIGLGMDTTDDTIFPTRGSRENAFIEEAGGPLGGTTNFTKVGASAAVYYPLPLQMVFGARGRIGAIQAHDGKAVPIFERYVLGGLNSIRGLQYLGIGGSGTSDAIGGTTMLVFNVELVFPLIKEAGMKGVVFYDTGNTWAGGYHLNDLRQTAGFGIRWYSPIGPLRLEYGYVLDRKENEAAGRFEFSIGMFN
jgi:outer membrane protein insertion porin family